MNNEKLPSGEYIKYIADLVSENELTKIEVETEEVKITIAKKQEVITQTVAAPAVAAAPAQQVSTVEAAASTKVTNGADISEQDAKNHAGVVTAPMVGIVFTRPDPNDDPYIKVGDTVKEGQTLLLVEAMKVFNPLKSPRNGVIKQIFVDDNEPVEFGQPLLIID